MATSTTRRSMPSRTYVAPRDPQDWYARFDWTATSVGGPDEWPAAVRTIADQMCRSPSPQYIAWGPGLAFVYNEAYAPILDVKHPAMGAPMAQLWVEIWDELKPIVEHALAGHASSFQDHPFLITRNHTRDKAWFSFTFTPLVVDGVVLGLHCQVVETTASVQAEHLRQAEMERLTSLFQQAPGLCAVLRGPEHVFELANPAYLEFVARPNIVGQPLRAALPELEQKFIDQLDAVLANGEPYIGHAIPVLLRRSPGGALEERIVDFVFQPIFDSSGRAVGIFIQGTDITEKSLAQREAETQRGRLDAVIESLPSGVVFADTSGAITRVNAANRSIWGAHPMSGTVDGYAEWKGRWADGSARHGQPLQALDWPLARALRGETVRGDIVEIEPFDRLPRRTLLVQATPVRLANGDLVGAVVAQTDIGDRMRAEAELRSSEARFRTITDAMPQMVWSTLPDGAHDYFNHQWYEFTGQAEGATDGDVWAQVLHPDDREGAWKCWRHSLRTGETYEIQYRLRHRSGEYRWVLGRALPVRDDAGAIVRWMGTCTDIHEQRLGRDALERSERALRQADRRKDEFLAMLAHELRNPLAPISTASQLLMLSTDPSTVRAAGEIIGRQVRHMTELVDDLLDVSRVTRGLVELEREGIDLKAVIAGAIEQVRPLIDSRDHALRTRLPVASLWVHGDRTRLVQVVSNLLNNAAKYTPSGGEITLDARLEDDSVVLEVRDNGQGIEADLLPQVFDLFSQGNRSPGRTQGGLGIGLALVRSLVSLHGGTVTASSDGGLAGSRFTVRLPAMAAPAGVPRPAAGAPSPASPALDVLVVDDNVDAAETLRSLLQAYGHRVAVFHTGTDALAALDDTRADVSFLDIGLPDLTGHELARSIRQRRGDDAGLLVALTGYGQPGDRAASLEAGFDRHMVKPGKVAEFLEVLAQVRAPG